MKSFFASFKPSIIAMVIFTLLFGLIYPCFVWCIGQILFRHEAGGSLFYSLDNKPIGSSLIAQNFSDPKYFHPRPSVAGKDGFNPMQSAGSNLSPTSQKWIDLIKQRATTYRLLNQLAPDAPIPSDAITASGSGLDPHISIANAMIQAPRVAEARNLPLQEIQEFIEKFSEKRTFGLFGQTRVNVLTLNLALNQMTYTLRN